MQKGIGLLPRYHENRDDIRPVGMGLVWSVTQGNFTDEKLGDAVFQAFRKKQNNSLPRLN
jgi:hypothetical protein